MKTNKILVALALPALLAACTADEIEVASVQQQTMNGRALLDQNFAINVNEGVGSRFAWSNYNWKFEEGDQFGASVTDVATQGTVTGTSLIGNYIFSKNEAGNWITDSQMSEGIYQYYSFDGFQNKMARELVAFDLTGQTAKLGEADAELNKYENQLMISPLYTLQAKYSTAALPLEFYSYYGVGAFKFKNNAGQDLKITQIILNSENDMVVKGRVNPKSFENVAEFVYNEDAEGYVLEAVDAAMKSFKKGDITATKKAEKIEAAEEAYEAAIYTAPATAELGKDDKVSKFITLDCKNYLLKEGKEVTAYMMLPAGATDLSVEIMVVDEEGESWSIYVNEDGTLEGVSEGFTDDPKAAKVKNLGDLTIQRHKTNAIFGKTTDGKALKTLTIEDDYLVENTGYYVDSETALLELLDNDLGDIKIHNSGDLYISKAVVKAINEYTGANVEFSNPIEIKSATALTEEDDLALSKITFGDVTVAGTEYAADGETVTFAGTTAELNVTVNGKLTIEAGANVTIIGGSYEEIVNNGTLSVKASVAGADITTSSVLNLKDVNDAASINLLAGTLNYKTAKTGTNVWNVNNANLTVGTLTGNATIVVDANVALTTKIASTNWYKNNPTTGKLQYALSLTNNGALKIADKDITIWGTLNNNGVMTSTTNHGLTVRGTTNNAADATIELVQFINYGTLNNNGDLLRGSDVFGNSNYGLIVAGQNSKTYINANDRTSEVKVGRINNSAKAKVSVDTDVTQQVFMVFDDVTATELAKVDFTTYSINTLRIEGTFTQDKAFDQMEASDIKDLTGLYALKQLELKDGAAIEVLNNVAAGCNFKKVIVEGNAHIFGWNKLTSTLNFTNNASIEVWEKGSSSATTAGNVLKIEDIAISGNHTIVVKENAEADYSIATSFKFIEATWANYANGAISNAMTTTAGI